MRGMATAAGCRLSALERAVLGFHRARTTCRASRFPRAIFTSCARAMPRSSTACSSTTATTWCRWRPSCRTRCGWPRRTGRVPRVRRAAGSGTAVRARGPGRSRVARVRAGRAARRARRAAHALARLAAMLGRGGQHDEAAEAWQGVLDHRAPVRRASRPLERRAAEALAIHHEHRARDLEAAHATPSA